MSEEERLALDIWDRVLDTRQQATKLRTGTLGDGAGNVAVDDRPGWSWIRFDASPNKISIVYNKYQNWAEDTYVVVGKQHPDDPYPQVLWINLAAYGLTMTTEISAYYEVSPHGETHLWGSTDPAWISTGNIVDGRITATLPHSMQVYVEEFLYVRDCTVVRFPGDFISLLAYVPTGMYGGSYHRYVLVYLDKATGDLAAVAGDALSIDEDPTVPAVPENGIPLGVIDISGLTTQIVSSMIFPYKLLWNAVCDQDIGDHTHSPAAGDGGESLIGFEEFMTACADPIYISGGIIIPTNFYHELYLLDIYISGLHGSADLVSIIPDPLNGCGQFLLLKPATPDMYASYTITLRHGIGNIWLAGERDVTLDEPTDHILLVYNGTWWCENISSASGYTDEDAIEALGGVTGEPGGFPNRTDTTISFVNGTRTFTIAPVGATFTVRIAGVLYTKGSESIVIPDVTNLYYIYYDVNGVLAQLTTPWTFQTQILVAVVYWNAADAAGLLYEERHGLVMDWATHKRLHDVNGTQVESGFALSGYTLQPAAPADADNTYAVATGEIHDEDIELTLSTLADNGPYFLAYRTGAAGIWTWNTDVVPFWHGVNYVQYNQFVAGAWQLTEIANNTYCNYYILGTNAEATGQEFIIIPGQNVYTKLDDALGETIGSLSFGTFITAEVVTLYQITYRGGAGYGSTGKCRIESVVQIYGNLSRIIAGSSPTSHAALSDRDLPAQHPADAIFTDITSFDGLLSAADTDVQLALDTLDKPDELWASDGDPQAVSVDAAGQATILVNLILDDGAGDSPQIQLVGGSNDDTALIYLDDDGVGGDSDLVIQLVDAAGDGELLINDSGGNTVIRFDSNGGAVFNENNEDADFRIEGTTEPNLFFVDASADAVGIGTAAPGLVGHVLDVWKSQSNTTSMMVTNPGVLRFSSSGIKVGELDTGTVATGRWSEFNYFNNSWNPAAGNEALPANGAVFRTMALATGGLNFVVNAAAPIRFFTGGQAAANEKVRIDATGQVGIGVADPDTTLEVFNAGNQLKLSFDAVDNAIFAVDTNGVLTITPSGASVDFADKNITNVGQIDLDLIRADAANGSVTIELDNAAGADLIVGNNILVVEGDNDRVGIGILAPTQKLHIVGRTYAQNGSSPNRSTAIQFFAGDAGGVARYGIGMGPLATEGFLEYSSGTSSNASFGHRFWINGNVVMELEGTGNVGIGIAAPVARLHIDQPSTTAAIPTLFLDQADLSEEFIEFASAVGAGNPIDTAAIGSYYGKVRVRVNGVGYKYIALYNT